MKKAYIAADLGASGGKMAIGYFENDKIIIDDYFNFPNQPVSVNGNLYWDLFGLYKSILQGASHYAKENQIVSIGVDTWGASYGFLDAKGRLLEPIYHYRDLRTEDSMEHMHQVVSEKDLFHLTGCQPNRSYTLPQLFSYVEHQEPILELADKLVFLPDLLEYFLSGDLSTERSIAGTSGMMKPDQDDFSRETLEKLHIPTRFLLPLTDAGRIRGKVLPEVAAATGMTDTNVISVPGHDTASAVVGIPGFGVNQVYVSMGTNVNMGIELTQSVTSEKAFQGGFKNAGVLEDRKILYKDFAAFWLANELLRTCKEEGSEYDFVMLMNMAQSCQSKRVFLDVDDVELNNAGGNAKEKINKYLRATGQETLSTDAEFARCIFESIALKVKYCVEYLRDVLEIPVKRVSVVNGGSRNYVVMQMISDALGMNVYAGMPYATLVGNILTQMYAMGEFASIEEIREKSQASFTMREYTPAAGEKNRWDEDIQKIFQKNIWNQH